MRGIDISRWQTVTDYGAAAAAASFVLLKSGGSNAGRYTDSRYAAHAAGFAGRGVPVGSYWMNGAGPVQDDANYFVANIRADARAFAVLDIESIDGFSAWTPAQASAWFDIVRAGLPGVPLFAYMNSSLAASADWSALERAGISLWVANYGPNNGLRNGEPGTGTWSTYAVHQYTSVGTHPGITAPVDLNEAAHSPADGGGGFLGSLSGPQQVQVYNMVHGLWNWGTQIHPWTHQSITGVNTLLTRIPD